MIKSLKDHDDTYASAPFLLFQFYFYLQLLFFIVLNLLSLLGKQAAYTS